MMSLEAYSFFIFWSERYLDWSFLRLFRQDFVPDCPAVLSRWESMASIPALCCSIDWTSHWVQMGSFSVSLCGGMSFSVETTVRTQTLRLTVDVLHSLIKPGQLCSLILGKIVFFCSENMKRVWFLVNLPIIDLIQLVMTLVVSVHLFSHSKKDLVTIFTLFKWKLQSKSLNDLLSDFEINLKFQYPCF